MATHIVEKIINLSFLNWTIRVNIALVAEGITATLACQEVLAIYLIIFLAGIVTIVIRC